MDSTALIPALRSSVLLKRAANLKSVAAGTAAQVLPAAAAVGAAGATTDWDPAAMTAAGIGARGLGHPLAGLVTRGTAGRAARARDASTAAQTRLTGIRGAAGAAPVPHVDAPRPVAPDVPAQLDLATGTPAHHRHLALLDRQSLTASNPPLTPPPATAVADHAKAVAEVDAANAAGRNRYGAETKKQRDAAKQVGPAEQAAAAAGRAADARGREAKLVQRAGAPVLAAGVGTAVGRSDTGQAVGDAVNTAVTGAGSKVKSVFTGDPKADWTQVAKDYAPAILGVGAVGALALWLMSSDDEEPEAKTAAVADDDDLARAARNRRRLEGLLARNPKALDNLPSQTYIPRGLL